MLYLRGCQLYVMTFTMTRMSALCDDVHDDADVRVKNKATKMAALLPLLLFLPQLAMMVITVMQLLLLMVVVEVVLVIMMLGMMMVIVVVLMMLMV